MTRTGGVAIAVAGGVLVGLVFLAMMAAAHEGHYRRRSLQLLEARVSGLEGIVKGDHKL